jgi:uncharacterized protein YjiS (DUF1127 family)
MFSCDRPAEQGEYREYSETHQFVYRACHGARETLYEVAEPSATPTADVHPKDRGTAPISLFKIFHCLGTAYRLGRERYRQRRQLLEMDYRQLKDIGITREQAEQEARKPIWKN